MFSTYHNLGFIHFDSHVCRLLANLVSILFQRRAPARYNIETARITKCHFYNSSVRVYSWAQGAELLFITPACSCNFWPSGGWRIPSPLLHVCGRRQKVMWTSGEKSICRTTPQSTAAIRSAAWSTVNKRMTTGRHHSRFAELVVARCFRGRHWAASERSA